MVPAPSTPTSADGVITIQTNHTVAVTAGVTADQVVIQSGGQLTVSNNVTLTIANGSGTDLDCLGMLQNAGTITLSSGATMVIELGW